MNIDAFINQLLFEHDCVIVPGLGGFVASPRAAGHQKIHHTFIPPARVIAFNVFLKQNDGLLANFISAEEKIPFSEAMNILEKYVERCFMEIEAGRRFSIQQVGQLYYDTEKNIQFEPDKAAVHSLDAFGLTIVRAIPLNKIPPKENVLITPLRQSVPQIDKPNRQRNYSGRKLMNALLVTGIALWVSFNLYIITPHNFSLGNLNPFERESSPAYTPRPADFNFPKIILPDIITVQPSNGSAVSPESPVAVVNPNISNEKKSGVENSSGNYFVVAGVFKIPSNAENLLAKLKTDGYENCGSLERENKPTMVFVSRHRQREDAVASLQSLREKGMEVWIFSGKK
jgi:hypothetical protein